MRQTTTKVKLTSCCVQQEVKGCALACIATILGKTYDEVRDDFCSDLSETGEGLFVKDVVNYVIGYGFDVAVLESHAINDYDIARARMLKPFADIHYLSVRQFVDVPNSHANVMDGYGNIFEPHDGTKYKSPVKHVEITANIGFWYPRGWKHGKLYRR